MSLTETQKKALKLLIDQIENQETLDERFQEDGDEIYVEALRELRRTLG